METLKSLALCGGKPLRMEAGGVRPECDLEVARLVCDKRLALGRGTDRHFRLLFSSLITFFFFFCGESCERVLAGLMKFLEV